MSCSGCGKNYIIVNKKYGLCQVCNHNRLHPVSDTLARPESTISKKRYYPLKRTKIKSTAYTKEKRKELLKLDEAVYFIVFNQKECKCEECGKKLPTTFKDKDGNINAIWQYSHILSKGAFCEHRHNPDNFNKLCFDCHQQWEFGDKSKMKIYEHNQLIIQKLKNEKK